ncbi:hypothetical protein [Burkholderia cepacia]|uniref:hypothetical protein n=1 Tax=Burkholderia cepacia TaxID=292 RepID=UPI001CF1917A|nr:hypothetical protein [Burkholderia cepacia]MCA8110243.1 hypothetical protein [Burkholderia cepacia]MCA8396542.1 hypothetical protein [Burkholderia cepacia]
MKTFKVAGPDGQKTLIAEQLATFAYYIQGVQFRFVVTRLQGSTEVAVTARNSGSKVAAVPFVSVQASLGDYVTAGKSALMKVIERAGEARVRSVLTAAGE